MDSEKRLKMVLDAIIAAHSLEVEAQQQREQAEAQLAAATLHMQHESAKTEAKPS